MAGVSVPQSDGDLDDEPALPVSARGDETQGAVSVVDPHELETFRRFQQFMRDSGSPRRGHRRRGHHSDDEEEEEGEGRGQSGPPPTWDGISTTFEDYQIKMQLWLATTKAKARSRGPLMLKALTGPPFEAFKHYAKDPQWLQDTHGAEKLLKEMDKPEHYGNDKQEHMLTALARITYHLKRSKTETWREFFIRWDTALRRVHEHQIKLPEAYEGFLLINGLQLSEGEVRQMLNFTHGEISPKSIKEWLRKSESKLSASELGADRKKVINTVLYAGDPQEGEADGTGMSDEEASEVQELEAYLTQIQENHELKEEDYVTEEEAAEILSTMLQYQKKKTFAQSQKDKKDRELSRGYRSQGSATTYRKGFGRGAPGGSFKVTIEALKKRTRCGICNAIGHWHKECPKKGQEKTNETHYVEKLSETNEAYFVNHLEVHTSEDSPENQDLVQHFASASSNREPDLFEPSAMDAYRVPLACPQKIFELFTFENLLCKLVKQQKPLAYNDETCATIDTGCQRLAAGQLTLDKYAQHLPAPLKITYHAEINRFRSVHQVSTTHKAATVPCSLGNKGCFLRPAVFEEGNSNNAPFLISLSFLLHCRTALILDERHGLAVRMLDSNREVPCHLGPHGSLRIPLQQFGKNMFQNLCWHQEKSFNQDEFEVFVTKHANSSYSTSSEPKSFSSSELEIRNGELLQESPQLGAHRGETESDVVSAGSQADQCPDSDQPLPEQQARGQGDSQEVPQPTDQPAGNQGPPSHESTDHPEDPTAGDRAGRSGTRRLLMGESTVGVHGDTNGKCLQLQPPSRRECTTEPRIDDDLPLQREHEPQGRVQVHAEDLGINSGNRDPLRRDSDMLLPDAGQDLRHLQARTHSPKDILSLSEGDASSMQLLPMDSRATSSARSPTEESSASASVRSGHTGGAGHVQPRKDHQTGIQCFREQEDLLPVQKGSTESEEGDCTNDRRRTVQSIPGMEEEQRGSSLNNERTIRKIRAALKKAIGFWTQIQGILSPNGSNSDQTSQMMKKWNSEICTEFELNPNGTKKTHEIAEIMGLSHTQLRTIAEVYNPACFGRLAKRHDLIPGKAFDLELGNDLLDKTNQKRVLDYLRHVKPGLVLVAPPCKMYSALQNLLKHVRNKNVEALNRYITEKRKADKLLQFAVEVCELCLELGLKFVLEHPLTAASWKTAPMQRLRARVGVLHARGDQCCFGLRGPTGKLHLKPIGFLCNDEGLASTLSRRCDKSHEHQVIIGGNLASKAQRYPEGLINAILETYSKSIHARVDYMASADLWSEDGIKEQMVKEYFNYANELGTEAEEALPPALPERDDSDHREVPELPESDPPELPELPEGIAEDLIPAEEAGPIVNEEVREIPLRRRFTLQRLLQRAHDGLGHPDRERFLRILRYSKASEEVLQAAKQLECSICRRHQMTRPPRRAAPPRELGANECIGVDVVYLPTIGQRSRPALNIIDWGTKFQMVLPLKSKQPHEIREAYRHWLRFFGAPQTIALDLGKEFKGVFAQRAETDGSFLDPASVEAPYQRAITERHGKTFKFMLLKAMDEYNCEDMKDWENLVDVVNMMKNRLLLKNGFSPIQRVLGYAPRLPGGLLSGDDGNRALPNTEHIGDLGLERSMRMRKAAAKAFMEADCEDALRRALSAGPRSDHTYEFGEMVYFFRMGADKRLKFAPSYWKGPARVVMVDPPSTVWLAYQGFLVKASPERLRRASPEERLSVSGWLQDIVDTKEQLATIPKSGYIDLSDEPIPPQEALEDIENYEPEPRVEDAELPAPKRRHIYKARIGVFGIRRPGEIEGPHEEEELPEREPAPDPPLEFESRGDKRNLAEETQPEEDQLEPPSKRSRMEMLEIYYSKIEQLTKMRQKKEIRLAELNSINKKCFEKAIQKEINQNIKIGAYKILGLEESARIRKERSEKIMESRFVLTAKPLEPQDVESAQEEQILLDWDGAEQHKAKARHVMKGYSEPGAEEIEAATPQVTREGTLLVTQLIASHKWRIGFLDFTQAFHSGDKIDRELYAEQPREGIPGVAPGQLIQLEKVCYGLTDGPLAWFRHLRTYLVKELGYTQSLADPCIYYKHSKKPDTCGSNLSGIIAVATDDLIHGGNAEHLACMEKVKAKYKLGKYQFETGTYTGKNFVQNQDGSIDINQEMYTKEKLYTIPIARCRKKQRYTFCNETEIGALRTSLGALSWLAKETRPDIAGKVALLQQAFPKPRVKDLIEANAITAEAQKEPKMGIKIMPIPIENLRVGVATDASWANAKDKTFLEDNKEDHWEETKSEWIRHHKTPRKTLFHPGVAPDGPDIHQITETRVTCKTTGKTTTDHWNKADGIKSTDESWTGTTHFTKQLNGKELAHNDINETFLQLMNGSSQGGYITLFYDKRLEQEPQPHMVSITSWKSTRLKRKTVNTLSAECQALITGIGNIHWHRYILLEALGHDMSTQEWETKLSSIPFVSVVDSRSLFDCINKMVCTFSQIEDKRTAIDLAILKDDMHKTGGHLRWVEGSNMITDPLTKRTSSDFLRLVCRTGYWSLTSEGHQKLCRENDLLVMALVKSP